MSENKFYIPRKCPFDGKRGYLQNKDIQWILKSIGVKRLKPDTVIDPKCNNFLICNYLDIQDFKFGKDIPLNKDIKNFCIKNNIKIIVCFSREHIHIRRRFDSKDYYYMFNVDMSSEKAIGFSFFDHAYALGRFDHHGKIINNNVEKTKKFSIVLGTLNKISRIWWCVKLIHDNLHNHPDILFGKISSPLQKDKYTLGFIDVEPDRMFKYDKYLIETLIENKDYIEQDTFIENDVSIERLYVKGREWCIPDEFSSTLINIVFETRPYDWGYGSLTEKIWKPIIAEMPFIWVSFENTKPYLENMGYKFHDFIDYSFDSIENYKLRFRAVYKEFERLNAFSFDELKAMVDNEKHITEHNKKVFYNTDYDKRLMNVFSSIK